MRREYSWRPNQQTRICSEHFVSGDGPGSKDDVASLFAYNGSERLGTALATTVVVGIPSERKPAGLESAGPLSIFGSSDQLKLIYWVTYN